MKLRVVEFLIGLVFGIVIMLALHRPAPHLDIVTPVAPPVASESIGGATEVSVAITPKPTAAILRQSSIDETPTVSHLIERPPRIPNVYRALAGPVPDRGPELEEIHALFENEPRDEPWAFAMETGINDHIRRFGAGKSTVVEYVECRSQHCEIAGYTHAGQSDDFGRTLVDMMDSGWWQADGYHHSSDFIDSEEGVRRFVTIMGRYRTN